MSKTRTKRYDQDGSYEVGYGKPPISTRFAPGQSGNPRGRPRGATRGRAGRLALEEAYRLVTVTEGGQTVRMPALQAVLRAKIALAAKGNGPAQRFLLQLVRDIEHSFDIENTAASAPPEREMSDLERARRIAFALNLGARQLDKK